MRRSPVALVPAAVGLLLAACVGDRDTTAPRVARRPAPPSLTASPQQRPPAISPSGKTRTRSSHRARDAVFTDITAMANAYGVAPTHAPGGGDTVWTEHLRPHRRRSPNQPPEDGHHARRRRNTRSRRGGVHESWSARRDVRGDGHCLRNLRGPRWRTVIPKAPALAKPDAFPRWGVESKTANMADVAGFPALPHSRRPGSSGRRAGWRAAVRAPDSSATTWPACRRVLPKDGLRVGICVKTTTSDLKR